MKKLIFDLAVDVLIALVLFTSGCALHWDTPAELHPVGPVSWHTEVQAAAEEWNTTLVERGCARVFEMGERFDVVLVPESKWPYPWQVTGMTASGGVAWNDVVDAHIDVRENVDYHRTLLHELGHAMGIAHTSYDPSIMAPDASSEVITERDADVAVATLGCP